MAPAAPYQAQKLVDDGNPYPLLLDEEQVLAQRIELGSQTRLAFLFNLRAWLRWLRAFARNRRQWRLTGRYSNVPGIVIVDADCAVRYVYRGSSIGDYPSMQTVLAELDQVLQHP